MTQGPGASLPIGVYRTPQPDLAAVQAYEQFIGRQVNYVLAFMADTPATWAQFETAVLQSATNDGPGSRTATEWAPLLGGRTLMLGVPACAMGTTWAQEAAGANNQHWAALARNLVAAGLGNCVLRIGREFNGSWYHWQVNTGNVAAYKVGYAGAVAVMRDAGWTGTFMWNPYLGQGTFGPGAGAEDAYPGDHVVDVIGVDVYDGNWTGVYPANPDSATTAQQQQVWDGMLTEWDSLRGWYNLARSHRKPLAFPEWGLRLWKDGEATYHGGGDNAVLVAGMAQFIQGCGAWMHAMWEDHNMGVSDPDNSSGRLCAVPMARAAFLSAFGTTA